MRQVLQLLSSGETVVENLPDLKVKPGHILIQTTCSLLSSGTERMLVKFSQSNLVQKSLQQPHRVADVVSKARNDGVLNAFEAVASKLEQPLPLGYCNVGVVTAVGTGINSFKVGDRVISNGPHADQVLVPKNLCALIPDNVSDESAVFTVLASIGLQGIRLAQPTFGETFVVSGLGLIGLLTAQILRAQGCRVLGIDPDSSKCALAESYGIESLQLNPNIDSVSWCLSKTNGIGVDAVLVTAATSSSEPLNVAAQICRQRGRIVLVGVTGMELKRDLFYKKELSFQVSCSYGPGRYDISYEEFGHDYPIGFVRWTEQRNFQAILQALSDGTLQTKSLVSHRFSLDEASSAYELLSGSDPFLGILIQYPPNIKPSNYSLPLSFDGSSHIVEDKPISPTVRFVSDGN